MFCEWSQIFSTLYFWTLLYWEHNWWVGSGEHVAIKVDIKKTYIEEKKINIKNCTQLLHTLNGENNFR